MSVWPQAAWIVKKLQANFDIDEKLSQFSVLLNNTNTQVDRLSGELQNDLNRLYTYVSSTQPSSSNPLSTGTLWLVTR